MMPLKPNQREYRALSLLQPSDNQKIDSTHYVEGYATTFDPYILFAVDGIEYNEKIDPRAFDNADMSDVIMQYDHSGKVLARTSNNTLNIETDERGLLIYADLSKSAAAREMHTEIKNGLVTKMSWAFTVDDEEYDRENRTRIIKRVKKVYDVSAVSVPANDGTDISARSYVDGVIDMERRESEERKRKALKLKLKLEGDQ